MAYLKYILYYIEDLVDAIIYDITTVNSCIAIPSVDFNFWPFLHCLGLFAGLYLVLRFINSFEKENEDLIKNCSSKNKNDVAFADLIREVDDERRNFFRRKTCQGICP